MNIKIFSQVDMSDGSRTDDSRVSRSHLGAAASAMTASVDDVIQRRRRRRPQCAMIVYDDVGDDRRSATAATAVTAAAGGGRSWSPEPSRAGRNRRCTVSSRGPVPSRSPCRRLLSDPRGSTASRFTVIPCRSSIRDAAPRRAAPTGHPSAHDSDPHTTVPACRVTVRDTVIPTDPTVQVHPNESQRNGALMYRAAIGRRLTLSARYRFSMAISRPRYSVPVLGIGTRYSRRTPFNGDFLSDRCAIE